MEDIVSELELTAASALLLLSSESFSSISKMEEEEEEEEPIDFASKFSERFEEEMRDLETSTDTATTVCVSSLSVEDSVEGRGMNLIGGVYAQSREFKLKVARKARSKVIYRGCSVRKPAPFIWKSPSPKKAETAAASEATDGTTITTEGSCLSSGGSSEISSATRSRNSRRPECRARKSRVPSQVGMGMEVGMMRRRGMGSYHIRSRAEQIKKMLSLGGCASEVRIRQVLGDSPDTSKALRILLRMEEVKRTGVGGRSDPFIYKIQAAQTDSIASLKPQVPVVRKLGSVSEELEVED